MDNRILWDIIDGLRDKNAELKAENKRLQVIIDKGINELQAVNNEYADGLLKIKELKAELNKVKKGNIDTIMDVGLKNETLQHEIFKLEADIKELKENSNKHYPKEYQAEAEEYFEHNPKSKYVAFYMLSEYDVRDGEGGDLMLYKDDAIAIIDNDNI